MIKLSSSYYIGQFTWMAFTFSISFSRCVAFAHTILITILARLAIGTKVTNRTANFHSFNAEPLIKVGEVFLHLPPIFNLTFILFRNWVTLLFTFCDICTKHFLDFSQTKLTRLVTSEFLLFPFSVTASVFSTLRFFHSLEKFRMKNRINNPFTFSLTFLKDSTKTVQDLHGGNFCCLSAFNFSSILLPGLRKSQLISVDLKRSTKITTSWVLCISIQTF